MTLWGLGQVSYWGGIFILWRSLILMLSFGLRAVLGLRTPSWISTRKCRRPEATRSLPNTFSARFPSKVSVGIPHFLQAKPPEEEGCSAFRSAKGRPLAYQVCWLRGDLVFQIPAATTPCAMPAAGSRQAGSLSAAYLSRSGPGERRGSAAPGAQEARAPCPAGVVPPGAHWPQLPAVQVAGGGRAVCGSGGSPGASSANIHVASLLGARLREQDACTKASGMERTDFEH